MGTSPEMQLTQVEADAARTALLGPRSDDLIKYVFALAMGRKDVSQSTAAGDLAIGLGWLKDDGLSFSPVGFSVADSIREYVFWVERGRRLHLEGEIACLSEAYYRNSSVLEIGCGVGTNLIPIRRAASATTGVEPNRVYRTMSAILCEREGLPPLAILHGQGEALPFPDEAFDLVLCVSVHQYTDVRRLMGEAVRVLKSGGELQIIGGTLATYMRVELGTVAKGSVHGAVRCARTTVNTVAYQALGRRVIGRIDDPTTRYPVYPTRRAMVDWLRKAGLVQIRPLAKAGPETIFCFRKP